MPQLEKSIPTKDWFNSEIQFNQLYPTSIQLLARRHFTPLVVARTVANFLAAEKDVRILDIGSGVGKFCLAAGEHKPNALFYGIEQRKHLTSYAKAARETLGLKNVSFITGNFTQLDFRKYNHFYFYNPFYENITGTEKIDQSIDYSLELYNYYNRYLYRQLEQKPVGTRLASFHSLEDEVPPEYHIVDTKMDDLLKFWIKL